MVNGELRVAYCFMGNDHLTGEMYDWKSFGGTVALARFKWLAADESAKLVAPSGYVYLNIEKSKDELTGGWWYSHDVPANKVEHLPDVQGMKDVTWIRTSQPFPKWAERYFWNLSKS